MLSFLYLPLIQLWWTEFWQPTYEQSPRKLQCCQHWDNKPISSYPPLDFWIWEEKLIKPMLWVIFLLLLTFLFFFLIWTWKYVWLIQKFHMKHLISSIQTSLWYRCYYHPIHYTNYETEVYGGKWTVSVPGCKSASFSMTLYCPCMVIGIHCVAVNILV